MSYVSVELNIVRINSAGLSFSDPDGYSDCLKSSDDRTYSKLGEVVNTFKS